MFCTRDGRNRLAYRNAYRDLKRVCEKVGVTGEHVHPHALRHAFAVNYIRLPGDAGTPYGLRCEFSDLFHTN